MEVLLDVAKKGIIANIVLYGDFFGKDDPAILAAALTGHTLERGELASVVQGVNISRFFYNMDDETFLSLLLD